jgi:hypothetical protein
MVTVTDPNYGDTNYKDTDHGSNNRVPMVEHAYVSLPLLEW